MLTLPGRPSGGIPSWGSQGIFNVKLTLRPTQTPYEFLTLHLKPDFYSLSYPLSKTNHKRCLKEPGAQLDVVSIQISFQRLTFFFIKL